MSPVCFETCPATAPAASVVLTKPPQMGEPTAIWITNHQWFLYCKSSQQESPWRSEIADHQQTSERSKY